MKDQVIQHSGRGHSELGPSPSERWLKCTPSAVLSAQFQDNHSVYAEEGTFLHELCELKLHSYLGDMTRDVIERQYAEHRDNDFYSDEAEEVTDVYVNGYATIGKKACASRRVPEKVLIPIVAELLGVEEEAMPAAVSRISAMTIYLDGRLEATIDGKLQTAAWGNASRRDSWDETRRKRASEQMKETWKRRKAR